MGRMKTLDVTELYYIIKDAKEAAINAYDMGNDQKAGQYEDEAHYASMELHRRSAMLREAAKRQVEGPY